MTTRELLAPLIAGAKDEVELHHARLVRAEARLALLRRAARGRGFAWVGVQDIELTVGRFYVVRRVSPRLGQCSPAVARWGESGWRVLAGELLDDHGTGATVEVWEGVP